MKAGGLNRILGWIARVVGGLLLIVLLSNAWIVIATNDQVYDTLEELPEKEVGLVLGTSHRLASGDSNQFFHQRMDLAWELYKQGKVKKLVVSGDNATQYYNEPAKMRDALIHRGVPSSDIVLDYAGFRTLDSVVRCKLVFGYDEVTVVTQTFHSYRALFIANKYDLDAVTIHSEDLPFRTRINVELRELLARTVAVWDLFVVNKRPKFLNEPGS